MVYMNKYLNWEFDLHFKLWEGENILISVGHVIILSFFFEIVIQIESLFHDLHICSVSM